MGCSLIDGLCAGSLFTHEGGNSDRPEEAAGQRHSSEEKNTGKERGDAVGRVDKATLCPLHRQVCALKPPHTLAVQHLHAPQSDLVVHAVEGQEESLEASWARGGVQSEPLEKAQLRELAAAELVHERAELEDDHKEDEEEQLNEVPGLGRCAEERGVGEWGRGVYIVDLCTPPVCTCVCCACVGLHGDKGDLAHLTARAHPIEVKSNHSQDLVDRVYQDGQG